MQSETDAVIRSLGDMLLQLGCDSGWLIPNTALNSKNLNNAISSYQAKLDVMELEITKALQAARAKKPEPEPEPEPVPEPVPEALPDAGNENMEISGNMNLNNDQLGLKNEVDGNDLGLDLTSAPGGTDGQIQDSFGFQGFDPSQNNLGDEYDFTNMTGAADDNFGMYDDLGSGMAKIDDGYGLLSDQF